MAQFNSYPQKDFSASDKLLAQDPSGSGAVSRVTGQSILDAAVAELEKKGTVVYTKDLLSEAVAEDYASGVYVLVGSNTSLFDGEGALYRVSDPGSVAGAIPMGNGNELVQILPNKLTVTTVDDIASLPVDVFVDQKLSVTGYHPSSTVGGGEFVGVAAERHDGIRFIDPKRTFPTPAEWAAGLSDPAVIAWFADSGSDTPCWELVRGEILYNLTVKIPTDYATLQDAVDDLHSRIFPVEGVVIDLNIESGHQLTAGLGCEGGDYSCFEISSVDATVTLDAGFVGVNVAQNSTNGEVPRPPLFYYLNARAAKLNCLIDMANLYGSGILSVNSYGYVYPSCGVINSGFRGLQQRGGTWWASETDFSGATGCAVRVQKAGSTNIGAAALDNACKTEDSILAALYVSRSSIVECRNATITNSGAKAILARRSIVTAVDVDFSNSAQEGIVAESGAYVDAINSTGDNVGSYVFWSRFGGKITASGATITNPTAAKNVLVCSDGGEIVVNGATTVDAVPADRTNLFDDVNEFNTTFGDGVVYHPDYQAVIESGSNADGYWQKFSDGRMVTWSGIKNINVVVASGAFSSQLTKPTLPQTFVRVDDIKISAVGKSNASGGGSEVFINSCHSSSATGNEWKIFNTGEQVDGAATGITVNSVQVLMQVSGTWR